MSAATMLATILAELALLPFAIKQRMRMKAAAKPVYRGQRNAWVGGAR